MESIRDEDFPAIKRALSAARMGTYEEAVAGMAMDGPAALRLYAWNAQASAAMLAPLHMCEVVLRNAVAEALEIQYGASWPWAPGFEQSLPDPQRGYSPRRELCDSRQGQVTTSKVIPELKLAFWQQMFTSRHDRRLWNKYLGVVMPNMPAGKSVAEVRRGIYDDLEALRKLRNRIAHHEPVFARNLSADLARAGLLVRYRCSVTQQWMLANQQVSGLLALKPC